MTFSKMILKLQEFWMEQGCNIVQPYDMPSGAGTFHPSTFLKSLENSPLRVAYVAPSRRPTDGRYGENPNRLGAYYQFQVIIKPSSDDIQETYLNSLKAIGMDIDKNDVRFVEDNWESPTLGAWGLGWEVWFNGMEISQFTYFQQVGGIACDPITVEITYGLERIAMNLQNVDSVYDIVFNSYNGTNTYYKDLYKENEYEFSKYHFEISDTKNILSMFNSFIKEAKTSYEAKLPLPAYDYCLLASHAFNMLDAHRALSTVQRQGFMLIMRDLTKNIAMLYKEQEEDRNSRIKS